jgi:hypothetical protein
MLPRRGLRGLFPPIQPGERIATAEDIKRFEDETERTTGFRVRPLPADHLASRDLPVEQRRGDAAQVLDMAKTNDFLARLIASRNGVH